MYSRENAQYKCNYSYIMGILLGFPYAYPEVPFYWLSFLCFGSSIVFSEKKFSYRVLIIVILSIVVALISNIIGLNNYNIDIIRIITTTGYFAFFVFGFFVSDKNAFVKGFLLSNLIISILIISMFFFSGTYNQGNLVFLLPELRLWGKAYFPDWPNFLAFFLSVSFLINGLIFNRKFFALISIVAAVLTTSRTPIIAIFIYVYFEVFLGKVRLEKKIVLILFSFFSIAVIFIYSIEHNPDLVSRLTFVQDRMVVYGFAIELIKESPLIGHGAILLNDSVGLEKYESFHNSYLDILVRHGFLGFILFIILIIPVAVFSDNRLKIYYPVILFFLISSLFQNFFKHPHLIMLYSVVLYSQYKVRSTK